MPPNSNTEVVEITVSNSDNSTSSSMVETLYEETKKLLLGGKLTPVNITTILVSLMQFVEKYPKLGGSQKKQVVLEAINMLINDSNDNVEESTHLKLLAQTTLPTVIDLVVSIDRRQVGIKLKKLYKYLLKCC
jgi:hypothetical protein